MTTFRLLGGAGGELTLSPATELVVAGYTGRDVTAVKEHIDELAAIGVAPPPAIPMVYRYPLSLLTTAGDVTASGPETSGEVEPVLIRQAGAWYLGVGSDHTDRSLERQSVERSKAVCPKPVAGQLIALAGDPVNGTFDAAWDGIRISSWADGELYQSAGLETMRLPSDLLATVLAALPDGADLAVFCGTVPLRTGTFVYAADWTVELRATDTTIRSDYSISFS
ncbi:MAG TPA: DUF2848 family protein [Trebonia sp.]|jgi:hypothetical protein|nr:DUF2848 family protein [Trebonia sp.]